MRKALLFAIACMVCTTAWAQLEDAFKGVWPVTDKTRMMSLNGEWHLKVVKGVNEDKRVPEMDYPWQTIPVPGCWEPYGFSEPRYDYPDSLTGYYHTRFTLPKEWRGQQVFIRFDGVLRGYDLWLNDQYVGTWESGYNTCLFDLTPHLTKKAFKGDPQQLSMRVYSHFKGYEFDCFDDWATMGIFRDVTLMAVPKTHLSDLTVTTRMNGEVTIKTNVANATKHTSTSFEISDAQGNVVSTGGRIPNPHLWTAETPYLYTLKVVLKEKGKTLQTFTHKIGIRETSIEGNVLKLNGRPIKLRGVNAHSTDPRTVKVISDSLTLKDMRMMKEASVNFIRLSHYPREPRFYELADSLGFYLVDEVPFGYGDKHLSNPDYQDILMTRAYSTVTRDKNHPSVLVWSVGNENPLPQTCVEVGDYVGRLDPSRPYCYPQVGSFFRRFFEEGKVFPSSAPIYAPHYPTTGQIASFYQHLDHPVIFTEYCHTLGVSFEDHDRQWEFIEHTPGIAGGGVWEWADQGMPFKDALKDRYGYVERVYTKEGGYDLHGNKGADGLLYADRTPLPNYYELQRNYARAFVADSMLIASDASLRLNISNRFDFLDLKDHVGFRWAYTEDRDTVARGEFSVACPPRQSAIYDLRLPSPLHRQKVGLYHCELTDAQGYVFLRQSIPVRASSDEDSPSIDERIIASLVEKSEEPMALVQDGPLIRAGRKATMAERLKVADKRLERYLLHPTSDGSGRIGSNIKVESVGNAIRYEFSLTPDTTDAFLSELGLAFLLTPEIDRVQWIGYGPMPSYPGRCHANRYGFWAMHEDDLYFEGNRQGVDAALLTDKDGNGLLLVCHQGDISFEQTDRGVVVTVNVAVSGQGPKFSRTAFPVVAKDVGTVSGDFFLYRVEKGHYPQLLQNIFITPSAIPLPQHLFETQYDTYLMHYEDIVE